MKSNTEMPKFVQLVLAASTIGNGQQVWQLAGLTADGDVYLREGPQWVRLGNGPAVPTAVRTQSST